MNDPTELGFSSNGPAEAQTVAEFRHALAHWLRTHFALGAVKLNDVLLAVNEALTNAAEFAYVGSQDRGAMSVSARYDVSDRRLVFVVSDHGRWLHKVSDGPSTRGRGIQLMRALADRIAIDRGATGTQVRLEFDDCSVASRESYATSA
jgi:serine/threonine-protein kinase RsbW